MAKMQLKVANAVKITFIPVEYRSRNGCVLQTAPPFSFTRFRTINWALTFAKYHAENALNSIEAHPVEL